jgi:hypothetical protein
MATPSKTRIPLARAEACAEAARALLASFCDRLEVAGSIRRRKADVGAVEPVAIPKPAPAPVDLFGTGSADFTHRLVTSRRYGGLMPAGMQVREGAPCDTPGQQKAPDDSPVRRRGQPSPCRVYGAAEGVPVVRRPGAPRRSGLPVAPEASGPAGYGTRPQSR